MKEGFLSVLKFFLFLVILPLIIAAFLAFEQRVLNLPVSQEQWFLWGTGIFVAAYLFLYNFKEVFAFNQGMFSKVFGFLGSLSHLAGLLIPLYLVLTICVHLLLRVLNVHGYEKFLIMACGFTSALHIICAADVIYEEDKGPLKAHYLLIFGSILILTFMLMAVLLSVVMPDFGLMDFIKSFTHKTQVFYQSIYNVLLSTSS